MQLLDFSAELISPQAIKAAGYGGAILYFSGRRPGAEWMKAKPATKEYCDSLKAAGLEIVSNYQFGKGSTSDWRGGFDAGVYHAKIALDNHFKAGGPGFRPIYAPVDDNPSLNEWNNLIAPFLRGWESVIGHEWTGIYCNARCIDWAIEDGLGTYFWQHNWSGNAGLNVDHPKAHLHQVEIDKRKVAGIGVDLNDILKEDYGQWSRANTGGVIVTPPVVVEPEKPEVPVLADPITRRMITPNKHQPRGEIKWIALHTQEANSTADNLAKYCNNPAPGGNPNGAVSYHAVGDDEETILVVPYDWNSWSASNANSRADHFCFAGSFAGWKRDKWLSTDESDGLNENKMLWRGAAWVAERCLARGIPIEYVGGTGKFPPEKSGVCGHVDFGAWGGGHTDPGVNFPWDELISRARLLAGGTGGPDMAFLDEKFKNWQGNEVSVRDYFYYTDLFLGLLIDQLNGPDSRSNSGIATRWKSLNNQTVVEALGTIGEALKIQGFSAPKK